MHYNVRVTTTDGRMVYSIDGVIAAGPQNAAETVYQAMPKNVVPQGAENATPIAPDDARYCILVEDGVHGGEPWRFTRGGMAPAVDPVTLPPVAFLPYDHDQPPANGVYWVVCERAGEDEPESWVAMAHICASLGDDAVVCYPVDARLLGSFRDEDVITHYAPVEHPAVPMTRHTTTDRSTTMTPEHIARLERIAATAPPAPADFVLQHSERGHQPAPLERFYNLREIHPALPDDAPARQVITAWLAADSDGAPEAEDNDTTQAIVSEWWEAYQALEKDHLQQMDEREIERATIAARNNARRQARWAVIYAQVMAEELDRAGEQ